MIEEVTTTIVIEPGWTARLDESGSYLITRDAREAVDLKGVVASGQALFPQFGGA